MTWKPEKNSFIFLMLSDYYITLELYIINNYATTSSPFYYPSQFNIKLDVGSLRRYKL